jgi:hypothetical protein
MKVLVLHVGEKDSGTDSGTYPVSLTSIEFGDGAFESTVLAKADVPANNVFGKPPTGDLPTSVGRELGTTRAGDAQQAAQALAPCWGCMRRFAARPPPDWPRFSIRRSSKGRALT